MGIAVKFLNATLSARFIMRFLQNNKNMGLPAQYFVAHDIFNSLTAIVTHGISGVPDIKLSEDAIVDLLLDRQDATKGIEVKFITWSYTNFAKAVTSAIKRKQTKYLLIVLSPTLRITHLQNTMFNKLNKGILSVVVIVMDTVEAKPQELWKEVQIKIDEQLNEGEEIVAFPSDLYNAYMFQKTKDLDIQNERLNVNIQDIKVEMQDMKTEMQDMKTELQDNSLKVQDIKVEMQDMTAEMQDMKTEFQQLNTLLKLLLDKRD